MSTQGQSAYFQGPKLPAHAGRGWSAESIGAPYAAASRSFPPPPPLPPLILLCLGSSATATCSQNLSDTCTKRAALSNPLSGTASLWRTRSPWLPMATTLGVPRALVPSPHSPLSPSRRPTPRLLPCLLHRPGPLARQPTSSAPISRRPRRPFTTSRRSPTARLNAHRVSLEGRARALWTSSRELPDKNAEVASA